MARAKQAKESQSIEQTARDLANKLRGSVEPAEYWLFCILKDIINNAA